MFAVAATAAATLAAAAVAAVASMAAQSYYVPRISTAGPVNPPLPLLIIVGLKRNPGTKPINIFLSVIFLFWA